MAPRQAAAAGLLLLTLATGCTRAAGTAAPSPTSTSAAPTASPPAAGLLCTLTAPSAGSPLTTQADYAAERHQWAVATQLYESALASATETEGAKACAAEGLAYIDATKPSAPTSAAEDTATAWNAFYADWLSPAERFGLPCLIVLVLLLSVAQLMSRLVVRPGARGRSVEDRRNVLWYDAAYATAAVSLAWASIELTTSLPLARGTAVRDTSWVDAVGLGLCGLTLFSVFAMFLVVGRPPGADRTDAKKVSADTLSVIGVATGVASLSLVILAIIDGVGAFPRSAPMTAAFASLLAVLAILVFARANGLAMGLRIAGTGTDGNTDKALADLVRIRLHALGSRPPRGIQMTEGTDVASLPPAAIGLLPDGPWLKAVNALLGLFTPSSPWLVDVTEQADLSLSVVISRNGSVVDARIIRPDVLSLPPPPMDPASGAPATDWRSMALRTGAAAFVLTTLAQRYRHLCIGLCGATEWRSLAAQVIATDPTLPLDTAQRQSLLANALNWDQDNLAAEGALLSLSEPGIEGPPAALARYLAESDAFCRKLAAGGRVEPGTEPLYLRTLFNIVIGRLNCLALNVDSAPVLAGTTSLHQAPTLEADLAEARAANVRLATAIATYGNGAGKQLAATMADALKAFEATVGRYDGPDGHPVDLGTGGTLQVQYGRACYYAVVDAWDRTIADLTLVACVPHTRSAAQRDPSFDALHDVDRSLQHAHAFKALIGDPLPAAFLDLPPFAASKAALNDMGIHTAEQLRLATRPRLAHELHLNPATMSRWDAICRMYLALVAADLTEPAATAVLSLLLQLDVDSPAALLAWRAAEGADQRRTLMDAARPYAFVVPTGDVLRTVLDRVSEA